jgi:hypothetical protein
VAGSRRVIVGGEVADYRYRFASRPRPKSLAGFSVQFGGLITEEYALVRFVTDVAESLKELRLDTRKPEW